MKKPLHIAVFVSYTYPFIGSGIGNVALHQAEYLAKQGHTVTIISSNVPVTDTEFTKNNVHFLKINAFNFLYTLHIPVPLFLFDKKVIQAIKNSDIVHVHDILYPSSLLAALVATYYKKPIIVMQHIPFIAYENQFFNFLQKLVFFSSGTYILRVSSKILYCNPEVAQWLKKYKEKLIFLPNGVDISFFHSVPDSQTKVLREKYHLPVSLPIILFVGRLVPKKGVDVLYKASSKDYALVFVGSGNIPNEMRKNPNIFFLGAKNHDELREIYQLSDIFVLPSHSEGYPLSVQEAMASGLAIIVSDLSCYKDMKLNRQLIRFINTTVHEIKAAITDILADTVLMEQMKQYSLQTAKQYYSWEKNVNRLVQIYEEVMYE